MEQKFSEAFNKKFLLIFTKELIINSNKEEVFGLKKILEKEQGKKLNLSDQVYFELEQAHSNSSKKEAVMPIQKEYVQEIALQKNSTQIQQTNQNIKVISPITPSKHMTKPLVDQSIVIPEPTLPAHLEYLKPLPSSNSNIDLFKLNPLLKDPMVKVITGDSEGRVMVSGNMGTKATNIFLTKQDVERIINQFSQASKIPSREGIYRVVVGNLNFSAIISSVIGSKFVIKKMSYYSLNNN